MEEHILETFILVLLERSTKSHGKNSISQKILMKSIIAQVIMMLDSINKVLNVEHC